MGQCLLGDSFVIWGPWALVEEVGWVTKAGMRDKTVPRGEMKLARPGEQAGRRDLCPTADQ